MVFSKKLIVIASISIVVISLFASGAQAAEKSTVPATVSRVFSVVFGENITGVESNYWKGRARSDKKTEAELKDAMLYQKSRGTTMPITVVNIIELTNKTRISAKLKPLKINPLLTKSTSLKAKDMLKLGYFAHKGVIGSKVYDKLILSVGYDYFYAGENLAQGFTNPDAFFNAWMESAGHRKNILNANYKDIGVAVVSGLMHGESKTVIVQHFGTI